MDRTTRRFAALVGVLMLVVAGCGGDTATTTEAPTTEAPTTTAVATRATTTEAIEASGTGEEAATDLPDPCSAWSPEDLAGVTGLAFPAGEFNPLLSVNGQLICDWVVFEPGIASTQTLVRLDNGTYDASLGAFPDAVILDIAGADAAYSIDAGKIIAMRVGDLFIQVAYLPATADSDPAEVIELAEIALSNL